ncbi:MAG: hypothetical protein ACI9YH_001035 [Colwellia sp.]|jgi:hypothetical protein
MIGAVKGFILSNNFKNISYNLDKKYYIKLSIFIGYLYHLNNWRLVEYLILAILNYPTKPTSLWR